MGAASSPALAASLVGRRGEWAALEQAFEYASAGQLHVVVIAGEPGIGKTRLAADFLERHAAHSMGLSARGYPFGATTSFGLWIEALDPYLPRLLSADAITARLTPHQGLLVSISRLVRELSATSPLVILLDDIHQADASSWEALTYVTQTLKDCPVLIVVTARPSELDVRRSAALLGMEQQGQLTRIQLSPLPYEQTGQLIQLLLGRTPPAPLVDWIFDHARGNPLFVILLYHELVARGQNLAAPSLPYPPSAVSDQVNGRLALLRKSARSAVEVLAVAGRSVRFELLKTLTQRAPDRLVPDIEALLTAQLVVEQSEDGEPSYRVAHPLIQEAIYHAISMSRRQLLHRAIARALLADNRLDEAATHYARAASVGEAEAADALIAALHASEQRQSPYESMAVLGALLRVIPRGDPRWVRVLDAMVWDAEWILDYNAFVSSDVGRRAMQEIEYVLRDSEDDLRRAVVRLRLAGFSVWDITQAEAGARACREALAVFEQTGHLGLALMARHWLAWIAGISDRLDQMESMAKDVIAQAESAGNLAMAMQAGSALGWCLLRLGRFEEGEVALKRATELAAERGRRDRLALDLYSLAYLRVLQGRLAPARKAIEEAKAINPSGSDPRLMAAIDLLTGDNISAFEDVRRDASAGGTPNSQHAWSLVFAVTAAARLGRLEEAEAWLEASRPYRGHVGLGWEWFAHWAEGNLQRERGELPDALESLRMAATGLRNSGYLPAAAIVLADVTDVLTEHKDVRALRAAANELEEIATRLEAAPYRWLHRLATAQLQWVLGTVVTRAAKSLLRSAAWNAREAARAFESLGFHCWESRALDVRARALSVANPRAASEALQRIVELSSRSGSVRRRSSAMRGLEDLGPRRRSAEPRPSLSARERQVMSFAVKGMTAREIGRRLRISKRTAESHLAHVYTKLGVRSRVELVGRAAGLATDGISTAAPTPKMRSNTDD